MDPPLRERLRWRSSNRNPGEVPDSREAMARTGALFAASGAVFALLSVAIPDSTVMDRGLLAAAGGGSALLAVALVLGYDRIPGWAFHAAAAVATVLATVAAYAWGTESAFAPFPYLWITVFVFHFFPMREAFAQLGLIAVGYGVALLVESPHGVTVDAWISTVGTLAIAGIFVALVRDRLERVIGGLSDDARRDALTDLLNRRGFEEAFDLELERARRAGTSLSLIVGDLDHFKRLNDEYGHTSGDAALRGVGRSIAAATRRFDVAARVGGEEFALLATECDEHGAYVLSERIRSEVDRRYGRDPRAPLTFSFGIATYPVHGQSPEALLRAADQALYAAKRLGRNRSVISSAEVPGILARAPRGKEERHVELTSLLNLAEALDVRDSGSPTHCQRVGRFAELVARELGLAPDAVERVRLAGILHDVGRVGVPDELLAKKGPLTDDEWALVRSHPEVGARMVETTDHPDIRSWILFHHERPDGRGYPEGRSGEDVPLESRILAVADAYEAMTSERAYRAALDPDAAAEELLRGAGRQFDPDVVDALLRVV